MCSLNKMTRENFPSFIPAEKTIPELTIKAILVGIFLAIVLGAANAYLGLYAGMTVSAIIPGAVMALALMKPFKPTILEVNIATMGASAGECIAAGVIFTIPALILVGAWTEINYLETTFISLIGGILGVLWMVPLRRALVVKTDLPFPEGIAVAAVLTTTVGGQQVEKKDRVSGIWLAIGALAAALFKFGQLSLNLFRDTIDGMVSIGKYAIFGKEHEAWFYGGTTMSPALLAVGWIIGPRISSYVLVGGLLGWVIIAPLLILVTGLPAPISRIRRIRRHSSEGSIQSGVNRYDTLVSEQCLLVVSGLCTPFEQTLSTASKKQQWDYENRERKHKNAPNKI